MRIIEDHYAIRIVFWGVLLLADDDTTFDPTLFSLVLGTPMNMVSNYMKCSPHWFLTFDRFTIACFCDGVGDKASWFALVVHLFLLNTICHVI